MKVTEEMVAANMQEVLCRTVVEFGKPVTYVTVKMKNGFTVRESTTCVDPANYKEETGKRICLEKIKDKIYLLLGYDLQNTIFPEAILNKAGVEDTEKKKEEEESKNIYIAECHCGLTFYGLNKKSAENMVRFFGGGSVKKDTGLEKFKVEFPKCPGDQPDTKKEERTDELKKKLTDALIQSIREYDNHPTRKSTCFIFDIPTRIL